MRTAVFLSLMLLLLTACTDGILVQMNASAPAEGWPRNWTPSFDFEIADTVETYNTFIDVRHTGDYPYSNLYLFMKLEHEGSVLSVDTVECPLAAPDGKWYGKGLGFIHEERFDAHILYRLNRKFPKPGKYTMTLEQGMRRETLEGILNVGISVEIVDP